MSGWALDLLERQSALLKRVTVLERALEKIQQVPVTHGGDYPGMIEEMLTLAEKALDG